MDEFEQRFGGIIRLYGAEGAGRLRQAHVCVVGLGGVGSWAVEALARSGIGALTLIDLDDVCVSNVNRQLHALDGTIGKSKAEVLAERARAINPSVTVHPIQQFFSKANADELLAPGFSYVLDAIDGVSNKALLISKCRDHGIPIITVGAAGGRTSPMLARVADLSEVSHDRLLTQVRKALRTRFNFPRLPKPLGVECVYSPEAMVFPGRNGRVCAQPEPGSGLKLDCNSGLGTAAFVTGAFGFLGASHIVNKLAAGKGAER